MNPMGLELITLERRMKPMGLELITLEGMLPEMVDKLSIRRLLLNVFSFIQGSVRNLIVVDLLLLLSLGYELEQ